MKAELPGLRAPCVLHHLCDTAALRDHGLRPLRSAGASMMALALVFSLPLPAECRNYSTDSAHDVRPQGVQAMLLGLINNKRRSLRLAPLRWEPNASRAAEEHSRMMSTRGKLEFDIPGAPSLEFLLQESGVPDYVKLLNIASVSAPEESVVQMTKDRAQPNFLRPELTHAGIGAYKQGQWRMTFIFLRRIASIENFPRTVSEPDRPARLQASLARGYTDPVVKVTLPSGTVQTVAPVIQGQRFSAEVPFTEGPGTYIVEVVARGSMGPVVTDLMPVYAAVPVTVDAGRTVKKEPYGLTLKELQEEMLSLINTDRREHKLQPVLSDAAVARIARDHSAAMDAFGDLAHNLPGEPDLQTRLDEAGILAIESGENLALGAGIRSAQRNLMASPAHRQTMLSPDFTHVGIGIHRARGGDLYVTQDFIRRFQPIDPSELHSSAMSILNKQRKAAGLPPLAEDDSLREIAGAHTALMAKRDKLLPPSDLRKAAKKKRIAYHKAAVEVFATTSLHSLAGSENLADRQFDSVGLSAIQVPRSASGVGIMWVTILYADLP